MNVIVEIDELLLEGLGPLDSQAVRAAVEQELGRLILSGGLPGLVGTGANAEPMPIDADGLRFSFKSASISINRGPVQSAPLGAKVAQAIYGGLSR